MNDVAPPLRMLQQQVVPTLLLHLSYSVRERHCDGGCENQVPLMVARCVVAFCPVATNHITS